MSYGIRKKFYHSKAWEDVRDYIPKEKRLIGIVHHKEYLDEANIKDINITLNANNLEGLCKDCHEKEHARGQGIRKGYRFDENGNLISE